MTTWLRRGGVAFLIYFVITTMIYRFRHPEMSETQLFLSLWEALLLRF